MRAAHKRAARERRHERIRKKIRGTAARPRLSVYRSNKHIYAQLVDDRRGHTLAAASSLDGEVDTDGAAKTDQARQVGELLAERAADADVTTCVLDRGGNRYAGRIAALAEAARDGGLDF